MAKTKRNIRIAAILMIAHGFIEVMGLFAIFAPAEITAKYLTGFGGMSEVQAGANTIPITILGVFWGITRFIAAAGILNNRKWAMILGCLISVVTLTAAVSIMPFGLMDTLFAVPVLVLLLIVWFGQEKIA